MKLVYALSAGLLTLAACGSNGKDPATSEALALMQQIKPNMTISEVEAITGEAVTFDSVPYGKSQCRVYPVQNDEGQVVDHVVVQFADKYVYEVDYSGSSVNCHAKKLPS